MAPAVHPTRVPPVIVTAAFASALPLKVPVVPAVVVMAPPAKRLPMNCEVVMVAAWDTHQVTLHGSAPPAVTTEKLVPVSAPAPPVPTLKIQVALAGPFRVKVPVSV